MPSYFSQQETGKFFLQGQEENYQVVIQYEDFRKVKEETTTELVQTPSRVAIQELEQARHPSGTVIKVMVGDIVTHKADAVANTANSILQHNGGLAKTIVEKGI